LWIDVEINSFWEWVSSSEIQDLLLSINNDLRIHWVLIESPLPKWLNYDELLWTISPNKDVDWLHINNLWKILSKDVSWILPATPLACVSIVEKIFPDLKWKKK
jgi:methylenetetrahydrofolate dehydrogenase (NADP+)/methenyltetrahydrofolate cyclohydrolase